MEKIKTAVIGCGVISQAYFESIKEKFSIIDLVAFCDHSNEKAKSAAAMYNGRIATIDEIIDDKSIELVLNLTTATAHYSVIKKLIEGGKNVYSEKVLTAKLEEAEELIAIADSKKLALGVAPDTFLGSAIQTARNVIESGMIGEVTSFSSTLYRDGALMAEVFPFTIKAGGGIAFDVGIYYITALLNCFGPVREVTGLMKTFNKDRSYVSVDRVGEKYTLECENLAAGTLSFKNGIVGNVLFTDNSILKIEEQPFIEVHGSLGVMHMADPNKFGGDVKVLPKGGSEYLTIPQTHGFRTESRGLGAAEMAWAIKKGRIPRANKEMAFHAMEVLHGLQKSGENKAFYQLKSTFEMTPTLPAGYLAYSGFVTVEESTLMF